MFVMPFRIRSGESSRLGLQVLEPASPVSPIRWVKVLSGLRLPGLEMGAWSRDANCGRKGGLERFRDGQRGRERGGLAVDLRTG